MHLSQKHPLLLSLFLVLFLPSHLIGETRASARTELRPEGLQRLQTKANDDRFPIAAESAKAAIAALTAAPVTTHERFATFISDDGFKSGLLIQNMRLDSAVTVRPALLLDQEEISLPSISIAPHATATVDITSALMAKGKNHGRGAAVVRYDFDTYGAVSAVVTSGNEARHLYLNSVGQSPEEFWYGTDLDAVLWAPEDGTQGLVFLMNTTLEAKMVSLRFQVNGRPDEIEQIAIGSHQHRILKIDSLVKRSLASGGALRLSFAGKPGDIIAEGALLNKKTGFSKYLRFLDNALHFPDSSLRTHFLLLGRQPGEDGFPNQVSFKSVVVIHNVESAPVQITPAVKRLHNGAVQSVSLHPITMGPNETRLINFSAEQRAGNLPQDFNQGSLQLISDNGHNSLVAELFNFSERGNDYVVGPSFSAFPTRATGSIWRIDGTFQTTLIIENTAKEADSVTIRIFSDGGEYEKTFPIDAGGLLKLNFSDLQRNAVPDKAGNLLTGTSGTLSLFGGNGSRSKLSFDKLIHSADESEYVGLLANPCNYVTGIGLLLDSTSDPYTYEAFVEAAWTDGSLTDESAFPSTGNANLVSVNGSTVTVHPTDSTTHVVRLSVTELETACDICSADDFFAATQVTVQAKPNCSTATVELGSLIPAPLEIAFPTAKTGLGAAAVMVVFPLPVIWNGTRITEAVSQTSNSCPATMGSPCTGSDTFTVGDGAAPLGSLTFPAATNIFYDFHLTAAAVSVLDPPPPALPITSCRAVCSQTYSCGGAIIGRFTITRDVTRSTINGTPVSRINVSKQ